jgi:dihydrofolate reductase
MSVVDYTGQEKRNIPATRKENIMTENNANQRKIIVTTWVTLDGYMAEPDGGMAFVGESFDAANGQYQFDIAKAADTLILGRVTYQSFAGSWPYVPDKPNADPGEVAYAKLLNAMRKIVYSRTLSSVEWENSDLHREIDPVEIAELKKQPGGNILVYGSASIVQALTNLDLVDEYQIQVHPDILGAGKPLFKNIEHKIKLKLVESYARPAGVVVLIYQRKDA